MWNTDRDRLGESSFIQMISTHVSVRADRKYDENRPRGVSFEPVQTEQIPSTVLFVS